MTDGKTQSSPFTGWLGRKKRVEQFLLYFGRNASAVVAYPDLDPVAQVSGRCRQDGLIVVAVGQPLALGGCIEAIGDQV